MKRILYAALAALSLVSPRLRAASDYLLELEGIKGESSDTTHPGAIEISSFSWGASNPVIVGAGGGSTGKVSFQDFHFSTLGASKASPQLFLACAQGKHIPKAVLTVRKAGGTQQEYIKIILTDILISGWKHEGNSSAPNQVESFSFNFAKIEFSHFDPSNTETKATWDLKTNTGG